MAALTVDRSWAVSLMRGLGRAGEVASLRFLRRSSWPPLPGAYVIGDPSAPVAVCTLTETAAVAAVASIPGVAIAGSLATANLGIERIVRNVVANPSIRVLVLWGRDSPLFRQGQTLAALCANGVDGERRVVGAEGYLPQLKGVRPVVLERFRRQVQLVDCTSTTDVAALAGRVRELAKQPRPPLEGDAPEDAVDRVPLIRPGGAREPLAYDPNGYFVITVDRAAGQIVIRHHLRDATPAHEMRGRNANGMLLGLLREHLVSQLSHAGYLGGELARAEAALRLDLDYRQDRPLTRRRQ